MEFCPLLAKYMQDFTSPYLKRGINTTVQEVNRVFLFTDRLWLSMSFARWLRCFIFGFERCLVDFFFSCFRHRGAVSQQRSVAERSGKEFASIHRIRRRKKKSTRAATRPVRNSGTRRHGSGSLIPAPHFPAGARFYFSFDFFGVLFFIFFSRPSSSSPSPSPLISILFFPLTKRFIHQAVERRFASFDAYLCDLIDSLSFIVSAGFPRSRQTSGVVLFSFFFARARDFLLPPQVLFPTRITDDETLLFGAHFFCSSKKTWKIFLARIYGDRWALSRSLSESNFLANERPLFYQLFTVFDRIGLLISTSRLRVELCAFCDVYYRPWNTTERRNSFPRQIFR